VSEDIKQHVDTNSAEFKQGVIAGIRSAEDAKNWQAGIDLGQELKDEREIGELVVDGPAKEPSTPLLMKDCPEGNLGNAQDEKDEAAE
jgi:hypothetical protein